VFDVSPLITDISNQPTIYVVDCAATGVTIDLTSPGIIPSSLKTGVTYYFIAKNTGAGTLQITYNSLDIALNPVTTAGVPAPLLITLVCVNYDGTNNYFSAST
jgi:archaellum component FlaG (FlaF/FlaG flagellin family)